MSGGSISMRSSLTERGAAPSDETLDHALNAYAALEPTRAADPFERAEFRARLTPPPARAPRRWAPSLPAFAGAGLAFALLLASPSGSLPMSDTMAQAESVAGVADPLASPLERSDLSLAPTATDTAGDLAPWQRPLLLLIGGGLTLLGAWPLRRRS